MKLEKRNEKFGKNVKEIPVLNKVLKDFIFIEKSKWVFGTCCSIKSSRHSLDIRNNLLRFSLIAL